MSTTTQRLLIAFAATTVLSACGSGRPEPHVPIPDDSGLYALPALRAEPNDEDDLVRLDGERDWEVKTWDSRSDLSPDVQFVVEDEALETASSEALIELWSVAWVRSDLRSDGTAAPVDGSKWAVARLEPFRIPLAYRPVEGRTDVIHAIPQERLAPGLYSIQLRKPDGARTARFGVDWPVVDRQEYSANHCVDRRSGGAPLYVLCAAPQMAVSPAPAQMPGPAQALEITLLEPVARNVGGQRTLLIQGTISNQSAAAQSVPLLRAALQDSSGAVISTHTFSPAQTQLGPGQSATFRTEIRQAPAATSRVNVSFSRDSASAQQ